MIENNKTTYNLLINSLTLQNTISIVECRIVNDCFSFFIFQYIKIFCTTYIVVEINTIVKKCTILMQNNWDLAKWIS